MRILVVDDHSLFREGIVGLLTAGGMEVVGQAGDGPSALSEATRLRPDLVLLDINMPDMSGLEVLRELRRRLPKTTVVILTVSDDDDDLVEAIKAGARGYLLKTVGANVLLERLHGLERGEAAMTGDTVSRLVNYMAQSASAASQPAPSLSILTQREREVLRLVALGLSNGVIGQRLGVTTHTVKFHVSNILGKLRLQSRAEAAAYVARNGLLEALSNEAGTSA